MIAGASGKVVLIFKDSYEDMVLLCFWTVDIKVWFLISRIPGAILQPQGGARWGQFQPTENGRAEIGKSMGS